MVSMTNHAKQRLRERYALDAQHWQRITLLFNVDYTVLRSDKDQEIREICYGSRIIQAVIKGSAIVTMVPPTHIQSEFHRQMDLLEERVLKLEAENRRLKEELRKEKSNVIKGIVMVDSSVCPVCKRSNSRRALSDIEEDTKEGVFIMECLYCGSEWNREDGDVLLNAIEVK